MQNSNQTEKVYYYLPDPDIQLTTDRSYICVGIGGFVSMAMILMAVIGL